MFTDADIHAALVEVRSTVPETWLACCGICGRLQELLAPEPQMYSDTSCAEKRNWVSAKVKPVFSAWLVQRGVTDPTQDQIDWPVEDPDAYFQRGNKWVSTHPAYWRRMDLLDFMINYYAP